MPVPPALRTACPWLLVFCVLAGPVRGARAADASFFFDATRAFSESRFEDVIASLAEGQGGPEGDYLKARALAELGRHAQAVDALPTELSAFPPQVREAIAEERVRFSARAGRCDELGTTPTSMTAAVARRLAAECAFRAGDFEGALRGLSDAEDVEGRSLRARALSALGRHDEARGLARELWVAVPTHADAQLFSKLAADAEGKLSLSDEERVRRGEAWLAARRFEAAVAELEAVAEPEDRQALARLLHLRGDAQFRSRKRYAEAAKTLSRAAALGGPTEAHDAFHAARALSRAGSEVRAIGEYDRFAKHYPKSRLAAEAAYLAAWLSLRRSRRDGERRLEAFVRSQAAKGSPRLRDDALWELGFSAFERGEHARSLRWLEKLPKAPSGMEAARVDYWRGRALVAVGSEKEARAAYRDALYREPLGWYAQLSAARLRELGEPPPPPVAGGVGLSDVARPELDVPSAVGFYRRLGMLGDAARVAEQWAEGLSGRLATIAAYATAGAVDKAHERAMPLLGRLMQVGPDEHSRWLWRAAFPEPYAGVVRAETERRGLPRELFYGHMQVESRYRPSVVSGADAVGLMQLLPSTAKSVAEAEGIDFERRLLMQPAVNVRLGAHYLSSLVKRYGEQWPLAIAAYNAGTQRVDGWLGRECPCELDRWVERIPVEQTRNYVRRVVGAWSRYHYLARPDAPWAVPLPVRVAR